MIKQTRRYYPHLSPRNRVMSKLALLICLIVALLELSTNYNSSMEIT